MFKKIIFAFLIISIISCQSEGETSDDKSIPKNEANSVSPLDVLRDSLTQELSDIQNQTTIPGFAISIIHNDGVVYEHGFGLSDVKENKPFTTQTVNSVASISKTIIGVSIMKLVEERMLNLNENINDILPYKIINPKYPNTPITVKHLITHTSSLTDDFDPEEEGEADFMILEEKVYGDDRLQAIMDEELSYPKLGIELSIDDVIQRYLTKTGRWYAKDNFENFKPGTKYSYSDIGAEIASRIVEIKSGMSFDAFTKKHIFDPLRMKNTGWFYDDLNLSLVSEIYHFHEFESEKEAIEHPKYKFMAYSSGGLKTNMEDLAKFMQEMVKGSNAEGTILNNRSYWILFKPVLDHSHFGVQRGLEPLNDAYNLGVFWAVSSTGIRLHNGEAIGTRSFMYFDPNTKSGAIGFCNLNDPSFKEIKNTVYRFERKMFEKGILKMNYENK